MTRHIRVGDTIHNFPDEATDDEISEALAGNDSDIKSPTLNEAMSQLKNNTPNVQADARDAVQGYLQSLERGGQGLANLALPKSMQDKTDYSWIFNKIGSGRNNKEANLARGAGEIFSVSPLEKAKLGEKLVEQATAKYPKIVQFLSKNAVKSLPATGATALNAPQGEKEEGAAVSEAMGTLLPGVFKFLEKSRPSKILRGQLSPEELQENLEASKGTETGLGDVIGNSYLKNTLETKASSIPFTGAKNAILGTAKKLKGNAENILERFRGNTEPNNALSEIRKAMNATKDELQGVKNQKEKALNKAAENAGVKVGNKNLKEAAQDLSLEIRDDPDLFEDLQDENPKLIKTIDKHANSPEKIKSLKGADISRPKLFREKASKLFMSGDKYEGGIYNRLDKAAKKDIDEALNASKDPQVMKLRDDYRKFYAEQWAPFEDKDIQKYLETGEGDTDLILNTFLKTSRKTDRGSLLKKLTSKLPDKQKDLLKYSYYKSAVDNKGNVNLGRLNTLHKALGPTQKEELFNNSPEDLKAMDNLSKGIDLNAEGERALANPLTGFRSSQWGPATVVLSAIGTGAKIAGLPGAIAGGAIALGGLSTVGKVATKKLTSEKLRENLVKQMLENKTKFEGGKTQELVTKLAQIINLSSRGNNNG